jgi:neutral ceramidase
MSGSRAGAFSVVITPPLGISMAGYLVDRKAIGVHDDLYANCLVVDDGGDPFALLSLDVIAISSSTATDIRSAITRETGIPGDRVLVAATHTHTGPATISVFATRADEDYLECLTAKCAEAVAAALDELEPAEIGAGSDELPGLQFNRRFLMKDGTIRTNPGLGNPDVVRPVGPVDRELGVIAVRDKAGQHIALIVNYALHLDTVSGSEISADWVGYMRTHIESRLGRPLPILFFNGSAGDINHLDVQGSPPPEREPDEAEVFTAGPGEAGGFGYSSANGPKVGEKVLEVIRGIQYAPDWPVRTVRTVLTLPVRRPTPEQSEAAKRIREGITWETARSLEQFYALELAEYETLGETEASVELQAVALGDTALMGIPNEVFTELGLQIKRGSPFDKTFIVELANGAEGYLPPTKALEEGGYETLLARSSKLAAGAGERVVEESLRLLHGMRGG